MKKLLLLLLLIPFLGTSQGTFTAPVGYNTSAPTAAPSGVGTRWRFDLLTGKKYTWNPDAMAWDEDPRGIDQISGCSAPMYTPGYNQSTFAVNSCSTPELYQYYSSAWHCLNCGGGTNISAGSGITLSGTAPDITISADDNSPTNELQTLSIDGSDLTLSDGGGTVTLPGGGGSPGGSNTYVQYNGLGSFAADNSFRFNNDTVSVDILRLPKTNAALDSGAIWIGTGMLPVLYRYNPPGATGGNIFVGGSGNTTMHVDTNAVQSSHNTIVGELSFGSNTIGYFNQVVGYQSLDQGRWAAGSCVLGSRALRYADGHDNIAVGDNSGYNTRSGKETVNIGYQANYNGRNYSNCVFIGKDAGALEADSMAGYFGSVAIGAGTRIDKSYQVVLGAPGTVETKLRGTIITDGLINANFVGGNIRLKADGTGANDGGLYTNASGNIWLGNWTSTRGWLINASGNIEQLPLGTLQTNRIGINIAPHATHALNVSGTSAFSNIVNFEAVGGQMRLKANGTASLDGGIVVNAAGNIWLGNWNLNRGWKVNASGSIEQLGSYTLQTGRIGVNTAPHATAALNVSGASIYSGQVDFNAVGGQFRLKADGTTNLDGGIIVTAPGVMYLTNWGLTRGFVVSPTGNIEVRGGPMTVGGTTADASAKLEVVSTTQGFLPPRMTTGQRNAIASPATGLTLYCTDCTATDASTGVMQTYNGSAWKNNW